VPWISGRVVNGAGLMKLIQISCRARMATAWGKLGEAAYLRQSFAPRLPFREPSC
jgi:hypothetical protein